MNVSTFNGPLLYISDFNHSTTRDLHIIARTHACIHVHLHETCLIVKVYITDSIKKKRYYSYRQLFSMDSTYARHMYSFCSNDSSARLFWLLDTIFVNQSHPPPSSPKFHAIKELLHPSVAGRSGPFFTARHNTNFQLKRSTTNTSTDTSRATIHGREENA